MRKPVLAICEKQRRRSACVDLISAFVVRCLDSIISLVSTFASLRMSLSRLVCVLPGQKSRRQVFL